MITIQYNATIHLLLLIPSGGGAGSLWRYGWVHPGSLASLSQSNTENHAYTLTPMDNSEKPIDLTAIFFLDWGGSRSTQKEATHS